MDQYKTKWLALFGLAFLLMGCGSESQLQTLEIQGGTMGTYYVVKVVGKTDTLPDGESLKADIDAELNAVNHAMSTYDPNSELSLFNKSQQTGPVAVSEPMRLVVGEALRIAQLSGGAFDPSVGPLVNLWGFGPSHKPEVIPSDDVLAEARQRVGYQHLELNEVGLSKDNPGIYLDLAAIAKGHGSDRVAQLLISKGYQNILVEVGGELRLKGHNDSGNPWRIAIEKPVYDGSQAIAQIIAPGDMGVATSGDYRNYFEEDGVRYSHTINPETGRPIENKVVSVTVVSEQCMTADGLATAFMVMGVDAALKYAEREQLAVMIIEKQADGFVEHYSEAFRPLLINKT